MLTNRFGILGVLAVLPAMAQVTSVPVAPLTTTQITPRQHAPLKFHQFRSDGTVESENWSGYAVTGTAFTEALGSWTVPTVNCSVTPGTYSSFWVGLDGYSSSTVEQTGTDSDCQGGVPTYYAWYEFYPQASKLIGKLTISPGDHISAEVSYKGGEFKITITDETTGQSFSNKSAVAGAKRTSAEWIAEAPCCTRSGGILPLSDFGTVALGQDFAGVNGTNYAISKSTSGLISAFGTSVQQIIMATSKGVDEAVPSPLSTDGSSFTVMWDSE